MKIKTEANISREIEILFSPHITKYDSGTYINRRKRMEDYSKIFFGDIKIPYVILKSAVNLVDCNIYFNKIVLEYEHTSYSFSGILNIHILVRKDGKDLLETEISLDKMKKFIRYCEASIHNILLWKRR